MNRNLQSIIKLMPPPAQPVGFERSWSVVETELGTQLPDDYKSFIDAYGSGTCCKHLEVWNFRHASFFPRPIPDVLWGNPSVTQWYKEVRTLGHHSWPYTMYPQPNGLLPFAVYTDIYHLNWQTIGSPNQWDIVYWCSDEQDFLHLKDEPFLEVLLKILQKRYSQNELPQFDPPYAFTPYSRSSI